MEEETGPVDQLPAPEEDGTEPKLEEQIVEYERKQRQKARGGPKKTHDPSEYGRGIKRWVDLFKPSEKGAGQMFVLVGKSERGKTHALRWILYSMTVSEPKFRFGLVFVRTKFKASYSFHYATQQHCKIYEGFRKDILMQYIDNLKQRYIERKSLEPSFIVFDDLLGILSTSDPWMSNFVATYRHYNITIFVAVQYLTSKNSVSPVMREQASYVLMFNSRVQKTLENLWENFGQLMPKKRFFAHLQRCTDPEVVGSKHNFCLYIEREDRLENNYISMRAPSSIPDGEVMLLGPTKAKPPTQSEIAKKRRADQLAYKEPSWLPQSLNLSAKDHQALQQAMFFGDKARSRLRKDGKSMAARDKDILKRFNESVRNANALAAERFVEQMPPLEPARGQPLYSYSDMGQVVHRGLPPPLIKTEHKGRGGKRFKRGD